jgi:hypothetical protein
MLSAAHELSCLEITHLTTLLTQAIGGQRHRRNMCASTAMPVLCIGPQYRRKANLMVVYAASGFGETAWDTPADGRLEHAM